MPTTARVANVDVLRAVAALAVLVIHAYALGGRAAPVRAQYWYDVPLINLASGVWLFFAISGYVIARPFIDRLLSSESPPAIVPYALRRAFRIFPLYWVALTLVIALEGLGGTRWWQLLFHYLLLNNLIPGRQEALFSVAWTLTLEVLFYIAVPVMASLIATARRPIRAERLAALVLASWALSIVFCVLADLQRYGEIGLWLRGSFPAMWQMFCPGILLAIGPHLTDRRWRAWVVEFPRRPVALPLAVGALLVAATLFADAPLRFGINVYQLLFDFSRPLFAVGYGLLIAVAIRARPWGGYSSWGFRLGLISYGIYLIHPVLADFLLHEHLAPVPRDTVAAFVVNAAVLSLLTVALALVSWRWLEQPAIALSRRLGARWQRGRHAASAPVPERSG